MGKIKTSEPTSSEDVYSGHEAEQAQIGILGKGMRKLEDGWLGK